MRVGVANQQRRHSSGLSTCGVSRPAEFAKGRGKKEREKRMLRRESEKKKRDL